MRVNRWYRKVWVSVMLLFTGVSLAAADPAKENKKPEEVKMHVTKSAKSHFVGQEFTYEILISGTKNVKLEDLEEIEGLNVKFLEKVVMDKQGTPSVALRFRMIPMNTGFIRLPMISLDADGQTFMTDEEKFIEVLRPEGYPGLTLQRELPQNDVYVGQPFLATYTWKSPLPLSGFRAVQLYLPLFYDSKFEVRSLHHWIDPDDKAAIGFPVSNTRLIARYEPLEEEGQFYNTVTFAKIVTAVKPGEFSLSPATFLGSYIEPPKDQGNNRGWRTSYPSYFNNNFFETIEGQEFNRYYMTSKPQTLHVLPLPDAGKPYDFKDQVGKLNVKVTASPKIVRAGDPITLTIIVDGSEFPETVNLPSFSDQAAFVRQFAMPSKQSTGRIEGKTKTFIRTLRPLAQDVTAIPSVRLPYFDPVTKSYGVAESGPIPITVKAAEMATAFDVESSGTGKLRNVIEGNDEGIRANFTHLGDSGLAGMSQWQWFMCCVAIPPLGFLGFYLFTSGKRLKLRDPIAARASGAMKRYQKAMVKITAKREQSTPEEVLHDLDNAVRGYFADKLNIVSHAHTYEELEQRIGQKIPPEMKVPLSEIYSQCEEKEYRREASNADLDLLLKSANQTISTIHPKL